MDSLDAPDTNIFWYRIAYEGQDHKSKDSKQYFTYVAKGNGYLLHSVEEELDTFIFKNLYLLQAFLVNFAKSGKSDIGAELKSLRQKNPLSRVEQAALKYDNLVKYLYAKHQNDLEPYLNLQRHVKNDIAALILLFGDRHISSTGIEGREFTQERPVIQKCGVNGDFDAYHIFTLFNYLQNNNLDGIFITYNTVDFEFTSEGKKTYGKRISVLSPSEFFSVPR